MKSIITCVLAIALIACKKQETGVLVTGKVTEFEISPADTHRYEISLNKDMFLALTIQQKGVDLKINILDPSGKTVGVFDSPNGQWGNENVSLFVDTSGTFTAEVLPLNVEQPIGKYTMELLKKEPRGTTPEIQVDQLFTFYNKSGSPGGAVSVAKGDKIIFSKGYGYANLEYGIPITPSTIFHIASVSKQFTAFSIALLANQGKISLDDDIRKYLPELHDFGETITIRHLIHHTSGLRDQWNLLALAGWRLDDVITKDQIMRLISHQEELNFNPGEKFLYCNTGYTMMGEIVSRVTGKSFADWSMENIFKPLEMNNTLFYDDHEKVVPERAYSYSEAGNDFKKSVLNYANVGATSLFTTVDDIQKWADNFRTMKIGNVAVMEQMHERGLLNNGDTLSYAFGQGIGEYKGLATRTHSGGDAGYRTFLARFPEQGYAISVFSNLGSFNTSSMAFQVVDIFMVDYLVKDEKEETANKPADEENVEVSESILQEYVGRYLLEAGLLVELKVENGDLMVYPTSQPSLKAIPQSDTVFNIPEAEATIIFRRNEFGKINRFILQQGGNDMEAPRMPVFDPSRVQLDIYTGTFYSRELQTSYTFKMEDDTLVAIHQRHDPIRMTPLSDDNFTGSAWFFRNVEFTRDTKGITGCLVSSGRVTGVRFDKIDCIK